jgi:predicted Rossmann fold nucleotide-binding protein DprA/Smf involved in DNA uptake
LIDEDRSNPSADLTLSKSLTPEERDFMNTMAQMDALYESKINEAKLEAEEHQKQTIPLNLLRKNIPIETIAEATGLTLEQL